MRRTLLLVVVAVLVLTVSACGGKSGLSQKDFNAQANAICAHSDAQLKAAPQPSANDLASLVPYVTSIESTYRSYLTQIAALATKARDSTEITTQWITPSQQDFAVVRPLYDQLVAAGGSKSTTALTAVVTKLRAVTDHTTAVRDFQQRYGATSCATLLGDIST